MGKEECNLEFFDKYIASNFDIVMYSMLGIGVLLNIFCCKYRKLAAGLFAYECVNLLLSAFICVDRGVVSSFLTFASLLIYVVTLGCHAGICMILSVLTYFLVEFVIEPQVTGNQFEEKYLTYHKILYQMSLFVSCSFGFIVIKWMFRLLSRLKLS